LTRRKLLLGCGATLLAAPVWPAAAPDDTQWAAAFIRQVGNDIAAIVGAPAPLEQRKQRLASLLDRTVDIAGAARFCLGRYWRLASPQQQRDYVELFHATLMRAVLGRIGSEQSNNAGIRVDVQRPEPRQDSVDVPTVIQRSGTPPFTVTWVVNTQSNDPRIIDVMAAGASLRITIRADYAAFLQQHGESIDALLQALRAQACDNCGAATGTVGR
jgi:phospholipid transport system substrate-binding protein